MATPVSTLNEAVTGSPVVASHVNNLVLDILTLFLMGQPQVITAAGDTTVTLAGVYVIAKTIAAANNVILPATGGPFIVADGDGTSNLYPVTVSVTGGVLINGATTFRIAGNRPVVTFLYVSVAIGYLAY